MYETVRAAEVLRALGLGKGDRVAFNLPNIPEQVFYTEAAKRLGIIYTPVFGGFSAKTLSDRIADAGARVVVTADGGFRNGEIVPYKERFTDPALDTYLPLSTALEAARRVLAEMEGARVSSRVDRWMEEVHGALVSEVTVERSDVLRELDRVLVAQRRPEPMAKAARMGRVEEALAKACHCVETVVVIHHPAAEEIELRDRDRWSHELLREATGTIVAKAPKVRSEEQLLTLTDLDLWRALAASNRAEPVDAEWPLFIIYTSGSTGKPKGVVHVHGGWLAGLIRTLHRVFGIRSDDRIYTIADPGWITGQSYLIAAPLAAGLTSIQAEGSPLYPHPTRFASIIERHRATIFKAGSTFLKSVMTDPGVVRELAACDLSSLKVATFCAEPVSPAVQRFAMENICPRYINSYWATEHGGMVLSCPWDEREKLSADAKTWALPWIEAEVRVVEAADEDDRVLRWRLAKPGEKGEIVITRPYPYLARTVWGDAERLGAPEWAGDLDSFTRVYFDRWPGGLAYTQGDYARHHEDGSFTLHGRSDDVINVSGHRIGTEEIEGALLRDKFQKGSPIGNAVVVGAPHEVKGQTPVAFLVPAPRSRITDHDVPRLDELVRTQKGVSGGVPSAYLVVSQFPETRSGKYVRRMLRSILVGEDLGDTSTLRNPEAVEEIRRIVSAWQKKKRPRLFGELDPEASAH